MKVTLLNLTFSFVTQLPTPHLLTHSLFLRTLNTTMGNTFNTFFLTSSGQTVRREHCRHKPGGRCGGHGDGDGRGVPAVNEDTQRRTLRVTWTTRYQPTHGSLIPSVTFTLSLRGIQTWPRTHTHTHTHTLDSAKLSSTARDRRGSRYNLKTMEEIEKLIHDKTAHREKYTNKPTDTSS